ncbi:helix-turn-helix domain-containing protein [Natrinema versiforme]|uniref:Helix-turn-helix domain-containing protein n=1 Tax=Natrinema versiforme TaxID=88724 RepID=A0A4V1G073_9EURY|nr:helix-turn-helix domain-containing protein [Natrinema versiforme]QCS44346.1 helix-turn-helix domain-containing protein [Natrinema versiforme]
MIDLDIDMRQYDCPFIDTTDDVDIAFSAVQWQLDTDAEQLETRLIAEGDSRETLEDGLRALRTHSNMTDCYLLSKRDTVAEIGTKIEVTNAMQTIQRNGGYITGPFQIENGRERWHIGFDADEDEDRTLAELERHNEFSVEDRDQFGPSRLFDLLENAESAMELLDGCRSLTETERETFAVAFRHGYYETPRGTTLDDLADHFDISKTAVSMNLRRSERKVLQSALGVLERMNDDQF